MYPAGTLNANNMNILMKVFNPLATPYIWEKGDWIDLRAAETVHIRGPRSEMLKQHDGEKYRKVVFHDAKIPLGVAMKLPEGMEAIVNTRSSLFKNCKVILANNQGVIDNSYNGDGDQWFAHVIALEDTTINEGDRICQFRILPSQRATLFQKLKWLFSRELTFTIVKHLGNKNRGGHGSSGIK